MAAHLGAVTTATTPAQHQHGAGDGRGGQAGATGRQYPLKEINGFYLV
jgi:hypothetical protein